MNSPGSPAQLQVALTSVARAIADSLSLVEVWERVADACRLVVPFDGMGVSRLEAGEHVRVLVTAGSDVVRDLQAAVFERSAFSPRLWPREKSYLVVIDDSERELDRNYSVDRDLLTRGFRSVLRLPLERGNETYGSLVLVSFRAKNFDAGHGLALALVAEMVTVALAHQALAEEANRAAAAQERALVLEERVSALVQELEALSPHRALGRSRSWRDVLALATKVAPTDTTVLITGESGTGKEVIARFVHRGSPRARGPFIALNCAALPEQLLESELFGHEKGAFTGALSMRPGKVELAAGGVLFLDEVGEMSLPVQAKLLRVLQEREFQRLGGMRTLRADVRILAATNRDLRAAIAQGSFREDLFYRLAVFDVSLPPLRERPEDIPLLADSFLEELGRSVGRSAAGISAEARETLLSYPWPGNVRELRNAIERAVILCEGGLIASEHLPVGVVRARSGELVPAPRSVVPQAVAPAPTEPEVRAKGTGAVGVQSLESAERALILQALVRSGNNKSKAARILGLTRGQLRSRIEKHGLQLDD